MDELMSEHWKKLQKKKVFKSEPMIEKKLKQSVKGIVFECEAREFKRVTPIRLERVFKYEDSI